MVRLGCDLTLNLHAYIGSVRDSNSELAASSIVHTQKKELLVARLLLAHGRRRCCTTTSTYIRVRGRGGESYRA
jgi:hypothetical protein